MDETKKEEPKEEVKLNKKAEDFAKAYQELCDKMGFRIVVIPVWIARDDNTWSLQLQTSVGKLPHQQ